jgi:hypothetical protein
MPHCEVRPMTNYHHTSFFARRAKARGNKQIYFDRFSFGASVEIKRLSQILGKQGNAKAQS